MSETADVIIVGGGVIGCSIAYYLAKSGVKATVLDQGQLGAGASNAAAGMLAPFSHTHGPSPFFDLCISGLSLFKGLPEELRESSGIDIEYISRGIIKVAFTEEEEEQLKTPLGWQQESGLEVRWLDSLQLRSIEPALPETVRGCVYSPEEHQVQSPRLVQAFAQAAARQGASFREGAPVTGLVTKGSKVTGVRVPDGELHAGHVVLATGAWTGLYEGWLGLKLPVFPVRGQVIVLHQLPTPVTHSVGCTLGYIVPKVDGSVIVGATVEHVGFDKRVTAGGVSSMMKVVPVLAPTLAAAEFRGASAGLRPGSADGSPLLGPVPGWEGVSVAAGHLRDGILLSAITGVLMAELITTGSPSTDLGPFSPGRFQ